MPRTTPPVWLLAALVALGPLSTDLYLPALPAIAAAFATDAAGVQWTLSGYLLGFAPAQLVYGPLADRFGRRPAAIAGLAAYLVATLACAAAPSLGLLTAARVAQALGACGGPVIARAVVRDTTDPPRAAAVFATIAGLMALAPAAGPILGGVAVGLGGWRAAFWLLAALAGAITLAAIRLLPETAPGLDRAALDPARLAGAYRLILRDRRFLGFAGVTAATYTGLFCFISGSSHVAQTGLGLGPEAYGVMFAAAVAGYVLGSAIARRLSPRLGVVRMVRIGVALCLAFGWSGPAALALFGSGVITVTAPMALYMIGFALAQTNAQAGAVAPFPHMAGRASALLGFVQWGVAALGGLVLALVLDSAGWAMAFGIALSASAAAGALALLPRH
ncbi:multidrug effflux MFS transporter [Elioraea sp.]|uniref:multidrug effflux MFS transporter n=1 Tax=Elioraea sp. TaxID=2185103 RepID=UPI00307DF1B3